MTDRWAINDLSWQSWNMYNQTYIWSAKWPSHNLNLILYTDSTILLVLYLTVVLQIRNVNFLYCMSVDAWFICNTMISFTYALLARGWLNKIRFSSVDFHCPSWMRTWRFILYRHQNLLIHEPCDFLSLNIIRMRTQRMID